MSTFLMLTLFLPMPVHGFGAHAEHAEVE